MARTQRAGPPKVRLPIRDPNPSQALQDRLKRVGKAPKCAEQFAAQFGEQRSSKRLILLKPPYKLTDTCSATCPRESVLPIRLWPDFSVVFEGYAGGAEHCPCCQEARKRSLRADILRT